MLSVVVKILQVCWSWSKIFTEFSDVRCSTKKPGLVMTFIVLDHSGLLYIIPGFKLSLYRDLFTMGSGGCGYLEQIDAIDHMRKVKTQLVATGSKLLRSPNVDQAAIQ